MKFHYIFDIETDFPALNEIRSDISAVEIHVKRRFQFAGMSTAPGKLAFAPARQKRFVHGKEIPPGGDDAFRVRLKICATSDQV